VNDPSGWLKAQVRVYGLMDGIPISDLPWAEYKLPPGSRPNDGYFTPCDVGDVVWVDFPYGGDTRRPRITGSVHYCPGGTPNLPSEALGKQNVVWAQHGIVVEVEESTAYRITQRATGNVIEIHDTGAYRILQGKTGAIVEIDPAGKVRIQTPEQITVKGSFVHLNP
jgi:hypothetical protein